MKRHLNISGQIFILAAFITLILLATVPLIVFLTKTYASHQVNQLKKSQSLAIAEAGISYASHELMNGPLGNTAWTNALNNNFGTVALGSPDCNTANPVTIPGVGSVKLTCLASTSAQAATLAPDLETYQVAVIATAYMPIGHTTTLVPTRAMEAYLSQRTLGITLPNGTQASAALQLARVPTSNQANQNFLAPNALTVHWGPIVDYQQAPTADPTAIPPTPLGPTIDSTTWQLADPQDTTPGTLCANPAGGPQIACPGYPRIFSNGGLTGAGTPPKYLRAPGEAPQTTLTDNYEWWAYSSLLTSPVVDVTIGGAYMTAAQFQTTGRGTAVTGITDNCVPGAVYVGNHISGPGGSPACIVDLNAAAAASMTPATVLFIDGADVHISAAPIRGTLIVMNNLLVDGTPGGVPNPALNVPTSAYKEYLAITSAQTSTWAWPCGNANTTPTAKGATCSSGAGGVGVGNINFTGFLYVGGNMTVSTAWVMNGALAVGDLTHQYLTNDPVATGQLIITTVPTVGQLTLLYDATIAHSIAVLSPELEIDRIQETTPQ